MTAPDPGAGQCTHVESPATLIEATETPGFQARKRCGLQCGLPTLDLSRGRCKGGQVFRATPEKVLSNGYACRISICFSGCQNPRRMQASAGVAAWPSLHRLQHFLFEDETSCLHMAGKPGTISQRAPRRRRQCMRSKNTCVDLIVVDVQLGDGVTIGEGG